MDLWRMMSSTRSFQKRAEASLIHGWVENVSWPCKRIANCGRSQKILKTYLIYKILRGDASLIGEELLHICTLFFLKSPMAHKKIKKLNPLGGFSSTVKSFLSADFRQKSSLVDQGYFYFYDLHPLRIL